MALCSRAIPGVRDTCLNMSGTSMCLACSAEAETPTRRFLMQVQVTKDGIIQWVSVTPSGTGVPYLFDTEEDAEHCRRMCYPDHLDSTRVVQAGTQPIYQGK